MTGPWPMMPGAPKPSILDRLAARLFPLGNYSGLLQPDQQQGLQRQGLLNVGLNLLQSGGAQPQQRGTLANLGSAIQGVDVNQAAQQALQLQAYRSQMAQQQAIAAVGARHPAKPGETRTEAYDRFTAILSDVASLPGGDAVAARLAPILSALKPDKPNEPQRIPNVVDSRMGSPTIGQSGTFLIPYPGAPREQWTFLKEAPKEATPKEPTPVERVAASQYQSASESIAALREIAQRNPAAAKAAVAAIKAARFGKLGTLYSELRGELTDPDAQNFYTNYNNALLAITPTYGGARPTQQLLDLEKAATLPAIGSGDFDAAFRHMENRLHDLQAKAGRAMPPARPHSRNPFAEGGAHYVP